MPLSLDQHQVVCIVMIICYVRPHRTMCVWVCVVEEMTRRRNELQQKLKHFPTDSLRARILKDTVVDGEY